MKLDHSIKKLPRVKQKVIAKALSDEGYSTRRIQQLIGVDDVSVWRYTKEQTPEELKQFEAEFKLAINEMKIKGVAEVHKRMMEIIPKYPRLDHLVKAGQYFEGKLDNNNNQINIQGDKVMVIPSSLMDKYEVNSTKTEEKVIDAEPIAEK